MSDETIAVLLIEDNPGDARLIREVLEEESSARFKLTHVTQLETGLERLDRGGIDVVLLDLSLPDSHGIETFKQAHAHSPQVPIVVLTGLNDDAVAVETLRAGGQDFLNKGALNMCVLHQSLRHAMARKEAEESHDASRAIEVANRVNDQFLTMLGEELRKPLRSLLSSVSALTREPTTGAANLPTLAMIRLQVELQGRMIDDILAYSQVESQGASFQPTDCEAVLEQALATLKPSIDKTGAVVTHDPLPSLQADGTQIGQLFQYLIGNAIKYRGEATPRVHVAAQRQGADWVFSVKDNGIGFDPEHAEPIFTIFQRPNDLDEYPGTGIGLAICKKIVERHAGRIWAESQPGRGSCFSFAIPPQSNGRP